VPSIFFVALLSLGLIESLFASSPFHQHDLDFQSHYQTSLQLRTGTRLIVKQGRIFDESHHHLGEFPILSLYNARGQIESFRPSSGNASVLLDLHETGENFKFVEVTSVFEGSDGSIYFLGAAYKHVYENLTDAYLLQGRLGEEFRVGMDFQAFQRSGAGSENHWFLARLDGILAKNPKLSMRFLDHFGHPVSLNHSRSNFVDQHPYLSSILPFQGGFAVIKDFFAIREKQKNLEVVQIKSDGTLIKNLGQCQPGQEFFYDFVADPRNADLLYVVSSPPFFDHFQVNRVESRVTRIASTQGETILSPLRGGAFFDPLRMRLMYFAGNTGENGLRLRSAKMNGPGGRSNFNMPFSEIELPEIPISSWGPLEVHRVTDQGFEIVGKLASGQDSTESLLIQGFDHEFKPRDQILLPGVFKLGSSKTDCHFLLGELAALKAKF
jgi:hypothetical protein